MRSFAKVYEIIISIRREFVLEIILIRFFFFFFSFKFNFLRGISFTKCGRKEACVTTAIHRFRRRPQTKQLRVPLLP